MSRMAYLSVTGHMPMTKVKAAGGWNLAEWLYEYRRPIPCNCLWYNMRVIIEASKFVLTGRTGSTCGVPDASKKQIRKRGQNSTMNSPRKHQTCGRLACRFRIKGLNENYTHLMVRHVFIYTCRPKKQSMDISEKHIFILFCYYQHHRYILGWDAFSCWLSFWQVLLKSRVGGNLILERPNFTNSSAVDCFFSFSFYCSCKSLTDWRKLLQRKDITDEPDAYSFIVISICWQEIVITWFKGIKSCNVLL